MSVSQISGSVDCLLTSDHFHSISKVSVLSPCFDLLHGKAEGSFGTYVCVEKVISSRDHQSLLTLYPLHSATLMANDTETPVVGSGKPNRPA